MSATSSGAHDRSAHQVPGLQTGVDQPRAKQAITHIVLMRVREDVPACMIERVFREIGALQSKIAGILSYAWGPSLPSEGFERGYTHGFYMTFVDVEARDAYLPHPEHRKAARSLLPIVEGGWEGLLSFDFAS
jgi:Stress responsive A/B Barrel Domain